MASSIIIQATQKCGTMITLMSISTHFAWSFEFEGKKYGDWIIVKDLEKTNEAFGLLLDHAEKTLKQLQHENKR